MNYLKMNITSQVHYIPIISIILQTNGFQDEKLSNAQNIIINVCLFQIFIN